MAPIWSNGQGPMTFDTSSKVQVVKEYIITLNPCCNPNDSGQKLHGHTTSQQNYNLTANSHAVEQ